MEQTTSTLLKTKLFRPQAPANVVRRVHLFSRLDRGSRVPLTVLSAPPGFGKTTLLADWAQRNADTGGIFVAWLSLDPLDNEPHHFLTYLAAALGRAQGGKGGKETEALAAMRGTQSAPASAVLTLLINDFDETAGSIVLVLDDYQFITSQAVHEAVTFLLEHMSPNLHLVISTRADPPLPLPRLRARGQMVEIRADDLRFTGEEVSDFLNRVMDLGLSPQDIEKLDERTEGWIAGLQMAALSMLGRPEGKDRSQFIETFSGSNRYILDYLAEEVLARQPEAVQLFLLHTSILDRLCAPLCDAVLATTDPGGSSGSSSQCTLEMLERDNLFLVPQDDDRHWYRYHHLFADLLRARLERSDPGLLLVLHARAAAWLDGEGLLAEAIAHWQAAGDGQRAGLLVQKNWRQMVADGSPATALGWIESLPENVIKSNPILGVAFCWLLLLTGHTVTVKERLETATQALARMQAEGTVPSDDADYVALPALIACVRATMARHHRDLREAIEQGKQAVAFAEGAGAWEQAVGWLMLGHSYRAAGQLGEAAKAYTRVISPARASGQLLAETTSVFYAAHIERLRGHLRRAFQICREALRLPDDGNGAALGEAGTAGTAGVVGSAPRTRSQGRVGQAHLRMLKLPAYSLVHLAMVEVLCERNELAQAEEYLTTAIELNRVGQEHQARVFALLAHARVQFAKGDLRGTSSALDEAEAALRELHIPLAETELQVQRARVWLAQGQIEAAAEWARAQRAHQEQESLLDPRADLVNRTAEAGVERAPGDLANDELAGASTAAMDLQAASYGRIQIALGQFEHALQYLDGARASAERRGNLGATSEVCLVKAVALQAAGRTQDALAALAPALELATTEGYARMFLDEGAPVATLLRLGVERGVWKGQGQGQGDSLNLDGQARRLLAAFGECEVPGNSTNDHGWGIGATGKIGRPVGTAGETLTGHIAEALTPRETQVLDLMARGLSNQEIADRLIVAVGTVKAQVHSICGKLDARNRVEALVHARDLHLL